MGNQDHKPLAFHTSVLRLFGAPLGASPGVGVRVRMWVTSTLLMVEHASWLMHAWSARHDMSAVTEGLGIGFEGLGVALRFYALALPGRARRLEAIAKALENAPAPGPRIAHERRMRRLTLTFGSSHIVAIILFVGLPWLSARDPETGFPPLPLRLMYPWGSEDPVGYGFSLGVQIMMMLLFTVTIPTVDWTFANLMGHASLRLRNVADSLMALQEGEGAKGEKNRDETLAKRLRQCVIDHQAALDMVEEVDKLLSGSLGFQLLSSSIVFCTMAYHVTRRDASIQVVAGQSALLIPFIMQLFIFCLFGDGVRKQGEAVAEAAWACGWENAPVPLRNDLRLILLRAQKPTRITAWISDVSLFTFGEVMKLSYSYYNLLNEAEKVE